MAEGMMISNRGAGGDNGGPIGSTAAVSIGNYKGVMLCNRPFAGASGAAAKQQAKSGGAGGSFKCGTVESAWGSNVSISEHQKLVSKMSKKTTVLSKHKKWLSDLQKTKDALQEEYVKELEDKEKKKVNFMRREAEMRKVVRGTLGPIRKGGTHAAEEKAGDEEEDELSPRLEADEKAASGDYDDDAAEHDNAGEEKKTSEVPPINLKKHSTKAEPKKPAWALTEEKATKQEDDDLFEEEEDLLDFAEGLDFDRYADDMELRILMDKVKDRIGELESENISEERIMELLQKEREERALTAENLAEMEAEFKNDGVDRDEADEVKSIAESVRSEASMREDHSQKSLEQLVAKSKAKMNTMEPIAEFEKELAEPRVITHTEDGGSRMKEKNNISKLPYMNRNPAI